MSKTKDSIWDQLYNEVCTGKSRLYPSCNPIWYIKGEEYDSYSTERILYERDFERNGIITYIGRPLRLTDTKTWRRGYYQSLKDYDLLKWWLPENNHDSDDEEFDLIELFKFKDSNDDSLTW